MINMTSICHIGGSRFMHMGKTRVTNQFFFFLIVLRYNAKKCHPFIWLSNFVRSFQKKLQLCSFISKETPILSVHFERELPICPFISVGSFDFHYSERKLRFFH